MRKILSYTQSGAGQIARGIGYVLSDDFKQSGAHRIIEFLMIVAMFGVYAYGIHQAARGDFGVVVAGFGALLLVLLFLVFVHNAFCGQTRTSRFSSRIGVGVFMLLAAVMTSTLAYQSTFVTGYANRKASEAVHSLVLYASQTSNAFSVAKNRYAAAASLSSGRAEKERLEGGTCNDGSGKGVKGPRNVWRDSVATQMSQDATEISAMEAQTKSLSAEIQGFGRSFDPTQRAVMTQEWGDLTARLQAVTTDPRIPQLVSALQGRLNQAERGIGQEGRDGGKAHVITCSDPDLRAAGDAAIAALHAIRPLPALNDPIVGADTDSSLHRILVLAGHPFGLTQESVEPQEYVVFFFALIFETLFIVSKANAYSSKFSGIPRRQKLSINELVPTLDVFKTAMTEDAPAGFRELSVYVLNRDPKRVRLGIPESDVKAHTAVEVLACGGHAVFVARHSAGDLADQIRARLKLSRRLDAVSVDIYDIPADTWCACMAATVSGTIPDSGVTIN